MSAILAKLKPWGAAVRRLFLGPNQEVLSWVDLVRATLNLIPSYYDVLRVIATHMGREAWDDMRLCIAWITERVSWSRRTVERALRYFKENYILRQDGEVPVRHGRPVVRYRLGSIPECPLPWHVMDVREERETAGQGRSGVYTSFTGPSVYANPQGETPEGKFMHPAAGVSQYRPALPVKTGPQAKPQPSGGVRRPSHLRWLRSVAESLVGRGGTPNPKTAARGAGDASGAVVGAFRPVWGGPLAAAPPAAVTYCHPPTTGAAVQPFIDPVFGNLGRDTRLLYLGLREAHVRGERAYSDPLFLKSQFFPYDTDITYSYVQDMTSALVATGKIHLVDDGIVLSDPPVTVTASTELALFDAPAVAVAPPVRARSKAAKAVEDPWFAAFWDAYPRRTGKGAARKAFGAAVAAGADPRLVVITASAYAERCVALQKEPQFIPHPSTWLNQERWDDDEEQAPRVRSKVDDALRSGLDLVNFYQQQEAIDPNGPGELGW